MLNFAHVHTMVLVSNPLLWYPYTPGAWSNFFSAETSASAGLVGLLFVAISINLPKIVVVPQLVKRAAKALMALMGVLIASTLCLVPGQRFFFLGTELVVVGLLVWIGASWQENASSQDNPFIARRMRWILLVLTQLSVIPTFLAGVSILMGFGGALYWLVAGTIFSFVAAMVDAWALLIEICR
jgi:hypothetical protein